MNYIDAYNILVDLIVSQSGDRILGKEKTGIKKMTQELNKVFENDIIFWDLMERLLALSGLPGIHPAQQGETLVQCALLVARKKDYVQAEKLLHEATLKYSSILMLRKAALASWMRGAVLWQIDDKHDKAISEWDRSVDLIKRYIRDNGYQLNRTELEKLANYIVMMENSFNQAIEDQSFVIILE